MPPASRFGPCYVALVAALSAEIEEGLAALRRDVRRRERNDSREDMETFDAQLLELALLADGSHAFVNRGELRAADRHALQLLASMILAGEDDRSAAEARSSALFQTARALGRARAQVGGGGPAMKVDRTWRRSELH